MTLRDRLFGADVTAIFGIVATGGAELLPAAAEAEQAAQASTVLAQFAGTGTAIVDCSATHYTSCAWDVDVIAVIHYTAEHPGGLPGAVVGGVVGTVPNPYDQAYIQSSTGPGQLIIEDIGGRLAISARSPIYGQYQTVRSSIRCDGTP